MLENTHKRSGICFKYVGRKKGVNWKGWSRAW